MRFFFCANFPYFYQVIAENQLQKLKLDCLNYFWGHEEFRPLQSEIIDSVLNGKDTQVLLPTGAGKSLCYQLPALLLEGICLVVSPLLALMHDQVTQLKAKGIKAAYLSSELEDSEAEVIYSRCKEGDIKLLYVSPERLRNRLFIENIHEMKFSFMAIDEAHCISEWGQDFRPAYEHLANFRNEFLPIPIIALTATATPQVLKDISEKLSLSSPQIFQQSFRRTNLEITHLVSDNKAEKVFRMVKDLNSSGIIYTRTRKEAENLALFLSSRGIKEVDFFHAGLKSKEKKSKQNKWLHSSSAILVATNAFGMGIDKEDVRFVIHYSPPVAIESYYQEIGRSGRDMLPAMAILLYDPQELDKFDRLLQKQTPRKEDFLRITGFLYSLLQVGEGDLPEGTHQLHFENLLKLSRASNSVVKGILQFLHNQELIYLNDYHSLSSIELNFPAGEFELLPHHDAELIELLLRQLPGISTHRVFFSESTLANKIGIREKELRSKLQELQKSEYIHYIDGGKDSIRFLKHRDERDLEFKWWPLYEKILKNKIQKWEEIKYFIRDTKLCKMQMILRYFGENSRQSCQQCSVCKRSLQEIDDNSIANDLLNILRTAPQTLEQIAVKLAYAKKEEILETLIDELDKGTVKMLNFRTYTIG